jgi:hypothetical protein
VGGGRRGGGREGGDGEIKRCRKTIPDIRVQSTPKVCMDMPLFALVQLAYKILESYHQHPENVSLDKLFSDPKSEYQSHTHLLVSTILSDSNFVRWLKFIC